MLIGPRHSLLIPALLASGCLVLTDPNDAVSITIAISTSDVRASEGFTITVLLVNHSYRTIRYETNGGCLFGYVIRDAADSTVLASPGGCPDTLVIRELPARRTLVVSDQAATFLGWQAGRYRVIGVHFLDSSLNQVRYSTPLEFTLTCGQPERPTC